MLYKSPRDCCKAKMLDQARLTRENRLSFEKMQFIIPLRMIESPQWQLAPALPIQ